MITYEIEELWKHAFIHIFSVKKKVFEQVSGSDDDFGNEGREEKENFRSFVKTRN